MQIHDDFAIARSGPSFVALAGTLLRSRRHFQERVCGVLIGGALVCWGIGYPRTPTVMFGLESGVVKAASGEVSTHLYWNCGPNRTLCCSSVAMLVCFRIF